MAQKSLGELVAHGGDLITRIDHINYVVTSSDAQAFIDTWNRLGFSERVRIESQKYAVTHIALASGEGSAFPWNAMTGLSFSADAETPVGRFVELHGPGVQYVAYAVNPAAGMEELHDKMKAWGWRLMGPALSYESERSGGPLLRMIAVAPAVAWGPFVLFIQRLQDKDGAVFGGYDILLWDTLYDHYVETCNKIGDDRTR